MKVQLIGLLLLVCGSLLAKQDNTIDFIEVDNNADWNAAFDKAKEENKLVFIDVYTDWCTYCKQLDEEVYTDKSIIEYFNENFINLKFNAETKFGFLKAELFKVSGFPTLLFLTSEKQVFHEIGGFVPAKALSAYGQEVQRIWSILPELEAKYETGVIAKEETLELINILEINDENRARTIAKKYIDALSTDDYLDLETIWLLSKHQNQLNGHPFQYIKSNKSLLVETHGINEYTDYMSAAYNDNLQLAIKYGDSDLLTKLVMEVLPEFIDNGQLPKARYTTKAIYFAQRAEFDSYKLEVNAFMNNHLASTEKPDFALAITYDIIENYPSDDMYQFTASLLSQALNIDEKNFELNSIMGYTKGLIGDYKAANNFLEKAKAVAIGQEELELLDSLLEAVKMMREGQY